MKSLKARVKALFGLIDVHLERETEVTPKGAVRHFDRKINGEDVLLILINREDGLKLVALHESGMIEPLFSEEDGHGR